MRIDLATEPDFELGPMRVSPATREVFAPSGREVLEPRVMMVLVALGQAGAHVVSRDALIQRCWDGLAVGDDAINRVIGRLRKLAAATHAFQIETITKVGYRLTEAGETPAAGQGLAAAQPPAEAPVRPGRLTMAAAAGLLGVVALGAWAFWPAPEADRQAAPAMAEAPGAAGPDRMTEELIRLGRAATREHSPQRVEQGVAQLREATVRAPQSAEAWGGLAAGYNALLNRLPFDQQPQIEARAKAAATRALALDPKQPDALMAQATLLPVFGNWAEKEALDLKAMAALPGGMPMRGGHARFETSVGRVSAAIPNMEYALKTYPTGLYPRVSLAQALWAVGRTDEADRLAQEALRLFPRNYLPWFHNAYLLMYSGRETEAVRFAADPAYWPDDVPRSELALVQRMAQALASRDPARADAMIAEYGRLALQGRG